ncbi:MAG: sterol desaturase family protein, partial [Paracoccaceae bacterium]|nr:sterol desaturase family protein [Paracoccaceae bacterium]
MPKAKIKGWNHIPNVPITVSPLFNWPLKSLEVLKWIWKSWFIITEDLILIVVACISFFWFHPPLEQAQTFSIEWVAKLYVRNIFLLSAVAGGLHLYFYTFTQQGQKLKYDPRPLMKSGKQFSLGGQVRDNMFWSL